MTINGQSTYSGNVEDALVRRGLGAGQEKNVDVNNPPYAIHNGMFGYGVVDMAVPMSDILCRVRLERP